MYPRKVLVHLSVTEDAMNFPSSMDKFYNPNWKVNIIRENINFFHTSL